MALSFWTNTLSKNLNLHFFGFPRDVAIKQHSLITFRRGYCVGGYFVSGLFCRGLFGQVTSISKFTKLCLYFIIKKIDWNRKPSIHATIQFTKWKLSVARMHPKKQGISFKKTTKIQRFHENFYKFILNVAKCNEGVVIWVISRGFIDFTVFNRARDYFFKRNLQGLSIPLKFTKLCLYCVINRIDTNCKQSMCAVIISQI